MHFCHLGFPKHDSNAICEEELGRRGRRAGAAECAQTHEQSEMVLHCKINPTVPRQTQDRRYGYVQNNCYASFGAKTALKKRAICSQSNVPR
jgi:hypothetical protein